jgi:hypothetical protein
LPCATVDTARESQPVFTKEDRKLGEDGALHGTTNSAGTNRLWRRAEALRHVSVADKYLRSASATVMRNLLQLHHDCHTVSENKKSRERA